MSEPYLGEIRLFSFQRIPQGWTQCAGQILNVSQNQALFALLGATYGGDGRTTFALPDLRGRAPLAAYAPPYALGTKGGAEAVSLTASHIPAHNHAFQVTSNAGTTASVAGGIYAAVKAPSEQNLYAAPSTPGVTIDPDTVQPAGGGQGHSNLQPYLAMSYCIATQGIFPPRPY